MLSLLNTYADGYVAIPVIDACRKQGFFDMLQQNQWVEFLSMVTKLNANAGYFKIALHLLESLGWLRRNDADAYQLTAIAQWKDFPAGLTQLYSIPSDTLFQSEDEQRLICSWIDFFIQRRSTNNKMDDLSWADRLEGPLFILLLPALRQHAVIQNGTMIINFPEPVRKAVIELFVHYEWGKIQQGKTLFLTELGIQLIERAEVVGIAASYRPMLAQMSELLFGNSATVFKYQSDGTEGHIDRDRNVLASGFQHGRFFKDAEKQILNIFNQTPVETQPRYIADMGCGDGTFLKSIYHAIREHSMRGKMLNEHPLILLGIDYNQVALQITQKNLEGLPHIILQGDINDPQQLLLDLQANGVDDLGSIFHVRSFLDHNFRYKQTTSNQDSIKDFPLLPSSVYVDIHGEPLASSEVLESWYQHLTRWAAVIDSHGLMVLEAHCLSAAMTQTYLGQSENFYFDHLHAFSRQYLIEAETFLLLAAKVGLFPKTQPLRYPKTLPFCRVTLCHFEKRNYCIRHACQQDLQQLQNLEQQCWPAELQTDIAALMRRIQIYPQGQFVLELNGQVVGAIYSQRIATQEAVLSMTADNAIMAHLPDGSFVQLLALNILPEFQGKQLGDQLLEWMLQRCSVMNGISAVVGVSLCKNYNLQRELPLDVYIHNRDASGCLSDPILRFHELHGAAVIGLVPNYRPNDVANEAHGVLVYYDIHGRVRKERHEERALVPTKERTIVSNIAAYIEKLIRKCLRQGKQEGLSIDLPLMDMGLDSGDLLEITLQVNRQYQLELKVAFFFRYNTLQKITTYLQDQLDQNLIFPIDANVA